MNSQVSPVAFEFPDAIRRKLETLEHEVAGWQPARFLRLSACAEAVGVRPDRRSRPQWRHQRGSLVSAVIEEPKCRITSLLNLRDDQSRADSMDRPGGHESAVARAHQRAIELVRRSSHRRMTRSQLRRSQSMLQSHGYLRIRSGGEDIPCLALAVCQTDRACEHIIRMHLNRERLAREDQLEKQGRAWACRSVRSNQTSPMASRHRDRRSRASGRCYPKAWVRCELGPAQTP